MSTMNTAVKFNLLGTMARSHDTYHVKNQIIHLVMTCTYCGSLGDLFDPDQINSNTTDKALLIKIVNSFDTDICDEFEEINDNTVMCTYSVGYITKNIGKHNKLLILLEQLYGSRNLPQKLIIDRSNLTFYKKDEFNQGNVFFIFENLHWFNIKHLFNMIGISISGGSINKRHLLSVTQLNLFKFFLMLKLDIKYMWRTTTNIYLKRNLYKTIQKGDVHNSENLNLIMYHLFFQSIEELHAILTELLIIIHYITYKGNLEIQKESNSDVSFSTFEEQYLNSPNFRNDETEEYMDMLVKLGYLCKVYSNYRDYLLKLWEKINHLDYSCDFNENDLLVSGIISNKELAHKFEAVSILRPYLDLLIDLYSNLYKRRQNLILNKDYTNYVNLLVNQKLPSSWGNTYDISNFVENIEPFLVSSNLKPYKSKLGKGFIPALDNKQANNKKDSNSRKYSTISYSGKLPSYNKKDTKF
jgi:hypothetical protein